MDPQTIVCIGICIALLLFFVILFCGFQKWKNQTRYEVCQFTKEKFLVQNNKEEDQKVGEKVATVIALQAKKADYLVSYMHDHKIPNGPISQRLYNRWTKIRKDPNGIREINKNDINSAAYSVNKNQVRLCVREKNTFQDLNTGFFVLLHELAHIMSITYGHLDEFYYNFEFLVDLATKLELYKYVDYSESPETYCNVDITSSII
jgi:hypothetical protein